MVPGIDLDVLVSLVTRSITINILFLDTAKLFKFLNSAWRVRHESATSVLARRAMPDSWGQVKMLDLRRRKKKATSLGSPLASKRCSCALLRRRLEVGFGLFRFGFDGLAPAVARVFLLAERLAHVPEVQQRFRKLRLLGERLLVVAGRFLHLALLLRDQAGIVVEFRAALAQIEQ